MSSFSVLVVNLQGGVMCATGLAREPHLQAQLLADLSERRDEEVGMVALEGEPRLIAAYRAMDDATVFLLQSAESEPTLFDFVSSVDFAFSIFTHLLNSPYAAMVVVDEEARIRYIPPVHEAFFGIRHGDAVGKPVTHVIENTRLHDVVRTSKAEIGKLQTMSGVTRVVSRIPIQHNGRTVGAIGQVMFKEPETVHELSKEVTRLRSEVTFYRNELSGMKRRTQGLDQMVGRSDAIQQLKSDIIKVAPLHVPVLIVGESGTGKELASHALHSLSPRNENPMVFVNAAALPSGLVESELFGYEAGAFTGAEKKGRKGKFELADRSSLFFDEIGDMPPEIQVKLLRVLQDGMFERVGSDRARHSDFRLICASNRDFQQMIRDGDFRLDLYYRISGVTIRMPSLRERLEDIPELVEKFLAAFAARHGTSAKSVDRRVYGYLRELPWPGNIRQLLHEVEKAAIFCDGPEIGVHNFRPLPLNTAFGEAALERMGMPGAATSSAPAFSAAAPQATGVPAPAPGSTLQEAVADVERAMIREAMQRNKGNKKKVAEELGISRAYLYKKLPELS